MPTGPPRRGSIRVAASADPVALLTGVQDLEERMGRLCDQLGRSVSIGVASSSEKSAHSELLVAQGDLGKHREGLHAAVARIAAAENAPVRPDCAVWVW